MTRAEAIEYIKTNCYGEYCEDDWKNTMDMAICSLEAWDNFYEWLKKLQEQQEEIDGGVSVLTSIHLQPLIEMVEQILGV